MQLQEGTLFDHDRYHLIKVLGSGGFSEVWLAEDTKVGNEKRALKVYAPGKGLDEDGVRLFSREFQLVYDLNHTNLLKPSHFDVCERSPYLVLPFCERGSAAKLTGKIKEEEAWHFLHDVAMGLSFLHEQEPPVIHQYIKPDNVLIDKTGRFLITDFGISAKARSTLRKSMGNVKSGGTIAFMAPERFGSDNMPIKASDIWSLGATMYELLTDDVPFGEQGGLIQKSGADIPKITVDYSQTLKEITYKMLSKETWDRPTAVQLLEWTDAHFAGIDPFQKKKKKEEKTKKSNAGKYLIAIASIAIIVLLVFFGLRKSDNNNVYELTINVKDANVSHADGTTYIYSGEMQNGEPNGRGVATYTDLSKYEGDFVNGLRKGWGKMTFPDKSYYEGEYLRDLRHGKGKMYFADKSVYEGEYVNDLAEGQGEMRTASGEGFKGKWKNDKPYDGVEYDDKGQVVWKWTEGERIATNN